MDRIAAYDLEKTLAIGIWMGGGAGKVRTPDPCQQATGLPRYRLLLLAASLARSGRPCSTGSITDVYCSLCLVDDARGGGDRRQGPGGECPLTSASRLYFPPIDFSSVHPGPVRYLRSHQGQSLSRVGRGPRGVGESSSGKYKPGVPTS